MAHDALSHEQALKQELEWLREYAVDAGLGPPSPLPFWEGAKRVERTHRSPAVD